MQQNSSSQNYRLKKTTKDEFMAMKALEEARKKGIAPAEIDEEGHEINPHIPYYIVKAPWYVSTGKTSLKHQRAILRDKDDGLEVARRKGILGQATKYRKGACENCGSMSHKAKDCLDRPRVKGAKWTGEDIMPDDFVQEVDLDFEGKRDRWAGYNPEDYTQVIDTFQNIEEHRKRVRDDVKDDDLYAEAADMPGQEVDQQARMTVRNLRLREDTAKYLRNLDPDSAYYDPKTRSMRENPHPDKPIDQLDYIGDNQHTATGEAAVIPSMQVFAWQEAERGQDMSLQATPTQAAQSFKQHIKELSKKEEAIRIELENKYGPQYETAPKPEFPVE